MSVPAGKIKVTLRFRDQTGDGYGKLEGYIDLEHVEWCTDAHEELTPAQMDPDMVYEIGLQIGYEEGESDERTIDVDQA